MTGIVIAGVIVGVLQAVIIALLIAGARWLIRQIREALVIMQDLKGDPGAPDQGIPERPGILVRQTRTEHRLDAVVADVTALRTGLSEVLGELRNNGGSSLRDAVDRLGGMLQRQTAPANAAAAAAPSRRP